MIRECLPRLTAIGISYAHAEELRRIAMTLHRWHELECGDGNDYASWTITRGRKARRAGQHINGHGPHYVFLHDENGAPHLEYHPHTSNEAQYTRIPDRETGAKKRLAKIMTNYPTLSVYIQGDPRGASLYILRPSDVPEGATADSCYSRGVAVYK